MYKVEKEKSIPIICIICTNSGLYIIYFTAKTENSKKTMRNYFVTKAVGKKTCIFPFFLITSGLFKNKKQTKRKHSSCKGFRQSTEK